MFGSLLKKLTNRRIDRVEDLEAQIAALEAARDEQVDINTSIRRDHEDSVRRREQAHEDKLRAMTHELDRAKAKLQTTDEEVGHLMKIRDEKREIELERKRVELERVANEKIAAVKAEYQTKIEEHLNGRIKDLGTMYGELLARLPDVNVALKGRIGG
jgi:chromosome segregation ATPase